MNFIVKFLYLFARKHEKFLPPSNIILKLRSIVRTTQQQLISPIYAISYNLVDFVVLLY